MKRPFHSRASRYVRLRRQSATWRSMVSPGARLVRVGRVEGGSIKPIATRPLVWNFSTFQPFNFSTSYYTHDMRPRRRRWVARRSVATEPRSGRKRPRNKNVSDVVAFDGLLAAHYEYAPFGKITVDTGGNEGADYYQSTRNFLDKQVRYNNNLFDYKAYERSGMTPIQVSLAVAQFWTRYKELLHDHMTLYSLLSDVQKKCMTDGFIPPYIAPLTAKMP